MPSEMDNRTDFRHRPRWRLWCAPVCLILSLASRFSQAQPAPVSEYQMKAAFVFNFAVFTEWPGAVLANGAPLTLCTYAGNELQPSLAGLNDKVVNGHRIVLKNVATAETLQTCHILVLDRADRKLWSQNKQATGAASILTVANESGIDSAVISLSIDNNRIGFDIDLGAARQARLTLSSKLLRLARSAK